MLDYSQMRGYNFFIMRNLNENLIYLFDIVTTTEITTTA